MKSKIWLNRQKKDQFVIKSKQKGYLSRSSFKLIEIENKYNFIKQSKTAIDFGSAPGGWCQIMIKLNQNIKGLIIVVNYNQELEVDGFLDLKSTSVDTKSNSLIIMTIVIN